MKDIVADNEATLYASFNVAFIDLENGRIDGLLIDRVYAGVLFDSDEKKRTITMLLKVPSKPKTLQ